jgi:hypothetical protein
LRGWDGMRQFAYAPDCRQKNNAHWFQEILNDKEPALR